MAIVAFDGFDHYASYTDLSTRQGALQWTCVGGALTTSTATGLGKAFTIAAGNPLIGSFVSQSTIIWGSRVYINKATIGSSVMLIQLNNSVGGVSNLVGEVLIDIITGSISYYAGAQGSGGSLVWDSGANAIAGDVWQFLEFNVTAATSATGSLKIVLNGQILVHLTGIATTQGGSAATSISYTNGGLSTWTLDDFYLCNSTNSGGTYPANDCLGDLRVVTLFATSNNAVQFTPLTGANWQEISETSFDGDTTYNYSSTPGQEDTFSYNALPASVSAIVAVQVTGGYRKDAAGTRVIKQALKSGGTEVYGANWSIPTSYAYFTDLWIADPNTSTNWTAAAVNVIKAGYNLVS